MSDFNFEEKWNGLLKDYKKLNEYKRHHNDFKCKCMNVPIYTCDMCKKEFNKYELSRNIELFADTNPKLVNGLCRECEEKVNEEIGKWLRGHWDELMENNPLKNGEFI